MHTKKKNLRTITGKIKEQTLRYESAQAIRQDAHHNLSFLFSLLQMEMVCTF